MVTYQLVEKRKEDIIMSKKVSEKLIASKRVKVALLCAAMLFVYTYAYVCGIRAQQISSAYADNPRLIQEWTEFSENPIGELQEALQGIWQDKLI